MEFKDHFSGHSADYSAYRPRYPESLFVWLASLCPEHERAWDCATGSGQAATSLANHFDFVIATDASSNQIADAVTDDKIAYRVAPAEDSGIKADSIDLITVAQALHWFDIPAFAIEVDRVLKPGGVLAVWTYGLLEFEGELSELIEHLYADIVGRYWPFERKMVEGGYADIEFPYTAIDVPAMEMSTRWTFTELLGYLNTWSAVKAYEQAEGANPIERIYPDLQACWGTESTVRQATWPLSTKAWRNARAGADNGMNA